MKLFDVYPLANITPEKAKGCWLWDNQGRKYLDLYGGHAVISIGHSHPVYIKNLTEQLGKIGFYSNSVLIPQQKILAKKLSVLSGYPDYSLFLCNSGAEANENALKLASFHTGRKKIVAFSKAFHGRTSLAVAATDDKKINAKVNETQNVIFHPFNDCDGLEDVITKDTAAVIVEGIQGVGGVQVPTFRFLKRLRQICDETGTLLIVDEIQSGYGRTGKFFAHQQHEVKADIITMAKGMGNGFPIGGVLITPKIASWHGMLGTTFGGNYLACAAAIAVLDVIQEEELVHNAQQVGEWFIKELKKIEGIKEVRGIGLMIGIELECEAAPVRNTLLQEHGMFTGASGKNTIRILPPLNISNKELKPFLEAFNKTLSAITEKETV